MIVDYNKLVYWLSETGMDPAKLKKELELPGDAFKKMKTGQETDMAIVQLICNRLGCTPDDLRYK